MQELQAAIKALEAKAEQRKLMTDDGLSPNIDDLRSAQQIACALARAAQAECDFLTDLITQLEPP